MYVFKVYIQYSRGYHYTIHYTDYLICYVYAIYLLATFKKMLVYCRFHSVQAISRLAFHKPPPIRRQNTLDAYCRAGQDRTCDSIGIQLVDIILVVQLLYPLRKLDTMNPCCI